MNWCFIPFGLLTLTFTLVAGVTLTVASGTFALVGTHGVDAVSSSTETWHCLALIHIWEREMESMPELLSLPISGLNNTHTQKTVYFHENSGASTIFFIFFLGSLLKTEFHKRKIMLLGASCDSSVPPQRPAAALVWTGNGFINVHVPPTFKVTHFYQYWEAVSGRVPVRKSPRCQSLSWAEDL